MTVLPHFHNMKHEVITTKEMLKEMEKKDASGNPVPFSFQYVTWNRNSRKGGRLKGYDEAELASSGGDKERKYAKTKHPENRNPNHAQNMTRNLFLGDQKTPQTFNIRGITRFNGKKVVY